MIAEKFAFRWLQHAGLSPEAAEQQAQKARDRSKRYPFPIPWVYVLTIFLIEWLSPLFLIGHWSRASKLDDVQFDKLEVRLHHNRWVFIRLFYSLVRLPIWEMLAPEEKPQSDFIHPLAQKLSTPRAAEKFDVLVIGSGAGGAPLAWSLSKAGLKVGVIESGRLTQAATTATAVEQYYFKQGMTLSTKGGMLPVFAGDTVGGTTSINSGTCLRPLVSQLEQWDQSLGTDFAQGSLDPFFDMVDEALGTTVPPKSLLGPSAQIFEDGLKALGRSGAYVLPRNAKNCVGSGRCCFVCPAGVKLGTDLAYLPEAVEHGCKIFAGTKATQICEDEQGVLVTVTHEGRSYQLRAKDLVLSAGAWGTPALIRKCRLGSHWRRAGRHLRVHPAAKVYAYMPDPINGEIGVPQGMGYRPPELPRITMEGIFTPKSAAPVMISSAGDRFKWWLDHYPHLASFGMMLVERTEGRVRDVFSWPVMRYRMHPQDVKDLGAAMVLVGKVFFAAGAKRVLLPVLGMENEFDSVAALERLRPEDFSLKRLIASGFHPQGTAAMGRVVDQDLALIGTRHIHVSDASVLPISPGVNPQVTIMGLALRLAARILRNAK